MAEGMDRACAGCGAPLPEGAEFCGECGAPVPVGFAEEPFATGAMKPVVERPGHVRTQEDVRRQKRRGAVLGVVLLLFVAAAVAGAVFYFVSEANSRAETERILAEHEREAQLAKEQAEAAAAEQAAIQKRDAIHNVTFAISGMDYDQYATRIPVQLTGTTAAGETVDRTVFVGSDGTGVSVPAGSYAASVAASPIASTGMLYTVSNDPMAFVVNEDDGEEVSSGQAITLLPIEASKITQEMIDTAYAWALKDEGNASRAEACKNAAQKTLSEWTEKRRAEEEKKAKLEARRSLAQEFVSEYYTTVVFNDQNDDSDVSVASNWEEVLEPYVKPGSKLAKSIAKGPGPGYSVTRSTEVSKSDEKTVTVVAEVAASDGAGSGWTTQGREITVVCTFDGDNLITEMKADDPDAPGRKDKEPSKDDGRPGSREDEEEGDGD